MDKDDLKTALIDASSKYSEMYLTRAAMTVAMSHIPIIGSALDLLMTGAGAKYQSERIDRFIKDVTERLDKVEITTTVLSEDFFDLTIAVLDGVAKTKSREKIRRFADIMANSAIKGDKNWDESIMAAQTLSSIDEIHIEILSLATNAFSKIPATETYDTKQIILSHANRFEEWVGLYTELSHYPTPMIDIACRNLLSKGLLIDQSNGKIGGQPFKNFKLSKTGSWFVQWIENQTLTSPK